MLAVKVTSQSSNYSNVLRTDDWIDLLEVTRVQTSVDMLCFYFTYQDDSHILMRCYTDEAYAATAQFLKNHFNLDTGVPHVSSK